MSNKEKLAPANDSRPIEQTDLGALYLVDGIEPVSLREMLEVLGEKPKRFRRNDRPVLQKPCDIGLFDEDARKQFDLF